MRPGPAEGSVGDAGAQAGQDAVAMGSARHLGVHPAAAVGFEQRRGGGEQADGVLGVVPLAAMAE